MLLREKIRKLHGLSAREIDLLLTEIATHAIVREPEARTGAPDPKDNHLWSLLSRARERAGHWRPHPRPQAPAGNRGALPARVRRGPAEPVTPRLACAVVTAVRDSPLTAS